MAEPDLLGFMRAVRAAARALKAVTGAVKINDEIHGNTVPHLYMHLFPRTADDPFPGQPIDCSESIRRLCGRRMRAIRHGDEGLVPVRMRVRRSLEAESE